MKFSKSILSLMVICLGLSACDTVGSINPWREEKPEPCPRITVLKNASQQTKFKEGAGRDLIDVLYEAEITNVLSLCKYDVDYDTRAGAIQTQVAPVIAAQRGAANHDRFADVTYFVAVLDQNKKILQKNTFPLRIAFPGNLTQNEVRDDPIDLTIVTDGSTDGEDFEIYIGFQLTREEMDYNERLSQR